jgi:hypothetical protein
MKKTGLFLAMLFSMMAVYGQSGGVKSVKDEGLEKQIKSSVGSSDYWEFSPDWYYSVMHSQYKKREDQDNNSKQLKEMLSNTAKSLLKVKEAHKQITVVYEQEMAHWNDRNNDWEYGEVEKEIKDLREAIAYQCGNFARNKVPVSEAQKLYDELDRIDERVKLLNDAHLDNAKRRKGYETAIEEYIILLNVCYRINYYCDVAVSYDDFIELRTKDDL